MEIHKINDFKVKAITGSGDKAVPVRGSELFDSPYCNIISIAGSNSGKTTLMYNCLSQVAYLSNILIFSPTINNDKSFLTIEKMLKKLKCTVTMFENYIDRSTGENYIDELLNSLEEEEKQKNEVTVIEQQYVPSLIKIDKPVVINQVIEKPKVVKPTIKKPLTASIILYFDDLSSLMKSMSLNRLMTRARHYKMKIFINLHSVTNVYPEAYQNFHYVLLFSGQNKKKLEELADKCGLVFKDKDTLWNAYEYATKEKYSFLYIDTKNKQLRKNFDIEIKV